MRINTIAKKLHALVDVKDYSYNIIRLFFIERGVVDLNSYLEFQGAVMRQNL
jgi:hypothetical protein